MNTVIDQSARESAIKPDASYIVQAPAGSGKTELLTQRILSLLAFNAQTPEAVLAITFTKKAAAEMRTRVLSALEKGKSPTPPESPHARKTWELARAVTKRSESMNWELQKNPQRLQVMTIDAFCASLVRQLPVLSDLGGTLTITEDANKAYLQAAKDTLTLLLNENDPHVKKLLTHLDNRQEQCVDMIANMLAHREQWLPVLMQTQNAPDLRAELSHYFEQTVVTFLENLTQHVDLAAFDKLKSLIAFACDQAENHTLREVATWSFPPPANIESLPAWQALYAWLFTSTHTVRKSPDKRMGFPAPSATNNKEDKALFKSMKESMKAWLQAFQEQPAWVESFMACRVLPSPRYQDAQWDVLESLLNILPHACAQLIVHFQNIQAVDFSAVAQGALNALGNDDDPTDLTLKLDYQIQHILIDEFQDTSLLQYQLLERLVSGWETNDGRTLFLVGDPMQSIYRFRQAEVGLFLRVQRYGLAGLSIENLHLQANFRSDPAIIDWVNTHAKACFAEQDDIQSGAISYKPSHAQREDNPDARIAFCASDSTLQQAAQLTETVKTLLHEDKHESIAVLVRARSHLKHITKTFREADIPYMAVELETLSTQSLIQDLWALTRAYLHYADTTAWLSVLHAPFVGLSLADITRIREADLNALVYENCLSVDAEILTEQGQAILKRVLPVLSHALKHRYQQRLAPTIQQLWYQLGGPACLAHPDALRLAESYFKLLAKHEQGGTLLDVFAFEQRLDNAFLKPLAGQARVQVMTMHKAKGLEFDVVLLPELQRRPPTKDQPLLLWEQLASEHGDALLIAPVHPTQSQRDAQYDFLDYLKTQKNKHELGRLMYVAMTRAKHQLHLFASLQFNEAGEAIAPAKGSLLSLLWEKLEDAFIKAYAPAPISDSHAKPEPKRILIPNWRPPEALMQHKATLLVPVGENHVPAHEFSYHQHHHRQFGVLLHRLLYKLTTLGAQNWSENSLKAQLKELGVVQQLDESAKQLLHALETIQQDKRGRWILDAHTQSGAELPCLLPGRGGKQGVIDRTFVDDSGVRWIIDYKTSQPHKTDLQAFYAQEIEQYRTQLDNYAHIFARSGEKTIRCALYFPLFAGWCEWAYDEEKQHVE